MFCYKDQWDPGCTTIRHNILRQYYCAPFLTQIFLMLALSGEHLFDHHLWSIFQSYVFMSVDLTGLCLYMLTLQLRYPVTWDKVFKVLRLQPNCQRIEASVRILYYISINQYSYLIIFYCLIVINGIPELASIYSAAYK